MNIALIVPTYNRVEYTKRTLSRLLEDHTEEFDLYLWDNCSEDETPEYLSGLKDPRIVEVVISKENVGQTGAMNYAWSKSKAELVGKVDNDCLVTPGWTRTFAQAHKDVPQLGAIGLWHFFLEDFDEACIRKNNKIQEFNGHYVFRHPWVAGSGFILKRKTFLEQGRWKDGFSVGTTYYFLQMALAGYVNGWYYPLILQEHMDDPKSRYCQIKDKKSFDRAVSTTFGLRAGRYEDPEGRLQWRQEIIRNLMDGPYDPRYYVGWRRKFRSIKNRIHDFITPQSTTKELDSTND